MRAKLYRIEGFMRVGSSWQKFVIEVPSVKISDAIEKVYSELGSRHKISRHHIRISNMKEIRPEEARRKEVQMLFLLDKVVKFY